MTTNFFDWEEQDFEGHPDHNAIRIREDRIPEGCPVKTEVRYGRGHVLPDGYWAFPGEQEVTEIITE